MPLYEWQGSNDEGRSLSAGGLGCTSCPSPLAERAVGVSNGQALNAWRPRPGLRSGRWGRVGRRSGAYAASRSSLWPVRRAPARPPATACPSRAPSRVQYSPSNQIPESELSETPCQDGAARIRVCWAGEPNGCPHRIPAGISGDGNNVVGGIPDALLELSNTHVFSVGKNFPTLSEPGFVS